MRLCTLQISHVTLAVICHDSKSRLELKCVAVQTRLEKLRSVARR